MCTHMRFLCTSSYVHASVWYMSINICFLAFAAAINEVLDDKEEIHQYGLTKTDSILNVVNSTRSCLQSAAGVPVPQSPVSRRTTRALTAGTLTMTWLTSHGPTTV